MDEALRLAGTRPVRWVSGHFDPLLLEHVRLLRSFVLADHLLIALVTNPASPLLPQQARAELVAALADVDYVVMKTGRRPAEEPEDTEITERFIAHVLRRNRGESA